MTCRICTSELAPSNALKALVSPWIRELANVKQRVSNLNMCPRCEGAYFSLVYSDAQMELVYRDYRGENYTKIRNRWEGWYNPQYNLAHETESLVSRRKQLLEEFLLRNGISQIKSVLDVGGDLGQYIPTFQPQTKRYVLDYSNRKLVDGVSRVLTLDNAQPFDLIIYAHVLEHIANPLESLAELLALTNFLYVEVPEGVPSTSILRRSRIAQLVLLILSLQPWGWSLFSKPSAGRLSTAKVLRQSEHLNFFTETTIFQLSQSLGCEIRVATNTIPTPDGNSAQVIQALFIRNSHLGEGKQ